MREYVKCDGCGHWIDKSKASHFKEGESTTYIICKDCRSDWINDKRIKKEVDEK